MKLHRTHPGNIWLDDAFHDYVERKLRESEADVTPQNIRTLLTAVLVHAIPAGNA